MDLFLKNFHCYSKQSPQPIPYLFQTFSNKETQSNDPPYSTPFPTKKIQSNNLTYSAPIPTKRTQSNNPIPTKKHKATAPPIPHFSNKENTKQRPGTESAVEAGADCSAPRRTVKINNNT